MLKIRLTRRGKRNKAFFRLVVAEHASPIKGKFIEALGFLNPHTKENSLKGERVKFWMEKGAQCSDSAHNMLVKAGILKGPKRAVKMKKKEPASSADKEIKSEEKTVPKKEKEEKAEKPKTEKPKEEKAAKELKPARDAGGEEKKEAGKKDEEAGSKEEKKEIVDGENKKAQNLT